MSRARKVLREVLSEERARVSTEIALWGAA